MRKKARILQSYNCCVISWHEGICIAYLIEDWMLSLPLLFPSLPTLHSPPPTRNVRVSCYSGWKPNAQTYRKIQMHYPLDAWTEMAGEWETLMPRSAKEFLSWHLMAGQGKCSQWSAAPSFPYLNHFRREPHGLKYPLRGEKKGMILWESEKSLFSSCILESSWLSLESSLLQAKMFMCFEENDVCSAL